MAKKKEEEIEEVPTPEEEIPPTPEEEATPKTGILSHTVDELPELAGKSIGDTITFRIVNISEDGTTYDLEIAEESVKPETAEAAGGREAVKAAML